MAAAASHSLSPLLPLCVVFVVCYLPHGRDALSEQVIVDAAGKIVGTLQMRIHAPEFLHLHTDDSSQTSGERSQA